MLSLAYSVTASPGAIVSPWGSNPSYTNGSIRNSNRPNEQAATLSYSYDFLKRGMPGLSATAIYSYAWDAKDPIKGQPLSNQWELDVLTDYKIPDGIFKGVWFRLQHNKLHNVGGGNTTTQWRAIVYWETLLI